MTYNTILKQIVLAVFIILFVGCKNDKTEETPFFEGEITLSESRGLYGSLFKVHTTYTLSEDFIKREQKLGGINAVFDNYAGIIIDLKKDSVVLYYADKLNGTKNKYTTSIKNFNENPRFKALPNTLPSLVDHTFNLLTDYNIIKHAKDTIAIQGYASDYTLYKDDTRVFKQEVYDTKDIKVKRELLEMVFQNLPSKTNFILKSDLKTTISDLSNDTIVNGKQSKAVDLFLRDVFQKGDKKTSLEKLAKNKWITMGLNLVKKGVDLNIHITTDISTLTKRNVMSKEFSLSLLDFEEVEDLDDFIKGLPTGGSGDFDD